MLGVDRLVTSGSDLCKILLDRTNTEQNVHSQTSEAS